MDEKIKLAVEHKDHKLDQGDEGWVYRQHWYQLWLPRNPPQEPPTSLEDASTIPVAKANILSKLTYHWITPIITLGYQRPLQAQDLWKMDKSREAGYLSQSLEKAWQRRCVAAKDWNAGLQSGSVRPSLWKQTVWIIQSTSLLEPSKFTERYNTACEKWKTSEGRKEASLSWALNDVFGWHFWAGGLYKVGGDISQLLSPLLTKAIIRYGQARFAAKAKNQPMPDIGKGIGLAVGLFFLTIMTSICNHQFFWRSMSTGVLARAALISSIYKRGLTLTPKARTVHSNPALVNHISTDVSRIDYAAQWFHAIWTAPIQVAVCLGLLIAQLGPSALAGFSAFVILIPIQKRIMARQFAVRRDSMKWTDQRSSLLQELLSAMRIIKYFTYELPFLQRLSEIRHQELGGVANILVIKAANLAIAFSVPSFAAVLSFVAYALAGNDLDPAIVFTALSFFQLLRQPLMFLPRALNALTDSKSAFSRLSPVFHAETYDPSTPVDPESTWAVHVQNATFQWEQTGPPQSETPNSKSKGKSSRNRPAKRTQKENTKTDTPNPAQNGTPFALKNVNLTIPRGQLCAITGPVGSGKSSLLQGLIGEMKLQSGTVVFGGRVGYCAQTPWIQNASLRENILFGAEWDEEKYWQAVQDASLLSDLEVLPDGDLTEIGERGINLSGGQKQRVNIARALFNDADVVILDDPLSAVDAHVGKALFNDAVIGTLKDRGKTVILVTHALHFLHQVDYIYNIVDGVIVEQGTYSELIQKDAAFAKLLKEFSGMSQSQEEEAEAADTDNDDENEGGIRAFNSKPSLAQVQKNLDRKLIGKAAGTGKIEGRLMKAERRTTGSIGLDVYSAYAKAGRGWMTLPVVLLTAIVMQGFSVVNSYWLIWWQANSFHQPQGFYMGMYAALGVLNALFTFALGVSMAWMSYLACVSLHHDAVEKVFHAPMSFFDTTPLGRILSIFGKDVDTIDNNLTDSLRILTMMVGNVFGSVIIVTYLQHYFILAVCLIAVGYWYFATYYGVSARELKRLDGNLRSLLYGHFAESLNGLSTVRAYGEVERFLRDNEYYIDLEDRALYLTITNQRWLSIRLDILGALMVFSVAIMAAAGVGGITPAQIGLVLVYSTFLTQLFGFVTRQTAEVESHMNAVERVVQYTRNDLIDQEAPHVIENAKPPVGWPTGGSLEFRDVVMKYRPGLPSVLRGISMNIRSGEKIGVVGRTGAGKSSLMVALYRIVELQEGSIWLDGIDISKIGLRDLRSKISIIPQDPLLFSGTIRSNLDPFGLYDDARLWDALRRSHLIEAGSAVQEKAEEDSPQPGGKQEATPAALSGGSRFDLETNVEPEGANLSVGERSLLSLARALVRDDVKLCILDEATASVDLDTDRRIQDTIAAEFSDKTLLCIAHRLRTIIHYDRILVLDAGQIAEFDTPKNLFMQAEGIFRRLCEQSRITQEDIEMGS